MDIFSLEREGKKQLGLTEKMIRLQYSLKKKNSDGHILKKENPKPGIPFRLFCVTVRGPGLYVVESTHP